MQPWFENLGKRLVRSPKVNVRDSGLLHGLLGTPDLQALQGHPKLGVVRGIRHRADPVAGGRTQCLLLGHAQPVGAGFDGGAGISALLMG